MWLPRLRQMVPHTCHQHTFPGAKGGAQLGPRRALHPFWGAGRVSVHPWHLGRPLFPSGLHILALKPSNTVKCLIALTRGVPHKGSGRFRVTGEEDISHMAQLHGPRPCLELSSCSHSSAGRHPAEQPLPGGGGGGGDGRGRGRQDLLSGALQSSVALASIVL